MNDKLKDFFTNSKGEVRVIQLPNVPLIVGIIASLCTYGTKGTLNEFFSLLGFAALFTWAWLEITSGSSPFRRTLGAIVMILIFISRLGFNF
jgi:hypothetical protein